MTRLGLLTAELCAGRTVTGLSDREVARLCLDFSRLTPPRYLATHREAGGTTRARMVGPAITEARHDTL